MSRMLCKCGAAMGSSESPSPYTLSIYYASEVEEAIKADSGITLHNFLLDWDEKNGCQHEYMQRKERVDYWYCLVCHRIYEAQARIGGRWLRVYIPSGELMVTESVSDWKKIYVMPETETDAATDKDPDVLLAEYLKELETPTYYLSQDETKVYAADLQTKKVVMTYELEESWNPNTD